MTKVTDAFRERGKALKNIRGTYGRLSLTHGADLCARVCDEQTAVDIHRSLESSLLFSISLRLEIITCNYLKIRCS